ncbi:MAG: flippase-like domain-containing protein [Thermoplasmatales archaeon]|nr:flippase-like domain-containing protein [Thermoplasmatales archaeon]
MKKINLKVIGKFLPFIGVALLIYMIYDTGFDRIANAFVLIPAHYYVIAFLPFFIRFPLRIYKWQYICKKQKMNFKYFYLMKVHLIGMFYGLVTPGGLGWHIRLFYLRKKGSLGKCIANSVLGTSTTAISSAALALIGSIVLFEYIPGLFPIILVIFLFYVAIFIVFLKHSHGSKIFNFFIKLLIPKKYKERVSKSVDALYEDIPRGRDLIIPIIIAIITFIITATQVYIIAQAFSIDVPYTTFISIKVISVFVTGVLPITVAGLGIREYIFVKLIAPYGITGDIAIAISLSGFIVSALLPALFGAALSFKEKINRDVIKSQNNSVL